MRYFFSSVIVLSGISITRRRTGSEPGATRLAGPVGSNNLQYRTLAAVGLPMSANNGAGGYTGGGCHLHTICAGGKARAIAVTYSV